MKSAGGLVRSQPSRVAELPTQSAAGDEVSPSTVKYPPIDAAAPSDVIGSFAAVASDGAFVASTRLLLNVAASQAVLATPALAKPASIG